MQLAWRENSTSETGKQSHGTDLWLCPFTFTGKLVKLTLKTDRPHLSPEDIKKLEAAQRNNKASE